MRSRARERARNRAREEEGEATGFLSDLFRFICTLYTRAAGTRLMTNFWKSRLSTCVSASVFLTVNFAQRRVQKRN